MNSADVVGYAFDAALWCPPCIRRKAAFQNEAHGRNAEFVSLPALLDNWRDILGFSEDEDVDTNDLPSPVFPSDVEPSDACAGCCELLVE